MKIAKRLVTRLLFASELVLFSWAYMSGGQGLQAIWFCEQENRALEASIAQLQADNAALDHELQAWQHHPFYKEKIARELLQMARPADTIYYLT